MSNQKTITLGQRKREVELTRDAQKAQDAVDDFAFETDLLNSFKQRVESGEFCSKEKARSVCATEYFDIDPSQETKDALEAFLDLDRDWATAHGIWASAVKAANDLEAEWAVARLHLLNHLGSDFIRSWSFEDGQLPIEALGLQQLAASWHRDGYIAKVNAYVNITPEGGATYKLVVSNPQRVAGQRDPQQRKTKKKA